MARVLIEAGGVRWFVRNDTNPPTMVSVSRGDIERLRLQDRLITIAAPEDRAIYVTIEDAAEVDAREAATPAFWRDLRHTPVPPLTAADLERAYGQVVEHDNRLLGAIPPGTIVQVPNGGETATRVMERQLHQSGIQRAIEALNQRTREQIRRIDPGPDIMNRFHDEMRQQMGLPRQEPITPEAQARAKELLLSHCTEAQKKSWRRAMPNPRMRVTGSARGVYDLFENRVERVSDGHQFCIQIVGEMTPVEDAVLMRKLLIETNEPGFLRIANDLTQQDTDLVSQTRGRLEVYLRQQAQQRARALEAEEWDSSMRRRWGR